MRNYLVKTGLAWLCVLSCVLTDASAALGLVLCAEPDGRVAIEPTHALGPCTGCAEEGTPSEARAGDAFATSGHCPCVDTPVVSVGDDSRPQGPTLEESGAQAFKALSTWHRWLSLVPVVEVRTPRQPLPHLLTSPSTTTHFIRTVILLV